jgi:hypothetical protein
MFMKWYLGRGNFNIKNGSLIVIYPFTAAEPAVIKNGEIYAKDKNTVSGYSGQHGHMAGL